MKKTQWHPLFARLLGLLLDAYYEIQPEVSVSDLPRQGDLLVVRRQGTATPPFQGLWSHLTEWNVIEYKGPTDDAEEDDLELLIHVGTGLTYKLNQERRARKEPALENGQMSFWSIARSLSDGFVGRLSLLSGTRFDYLTDGAWRGRIGGHPVMLVSGRDLPVEVDCVPLHLLQRDQKPPRALGELVVGRGELLKQFAGWVQTLQPALWKEIQVMAESSGIIDWKAVSEVANLDEVIRFLPPEHVIEVLGLTKIIETCGEEKVLAELLARMPKEKVQKLAAGEGGEEKKGMPEPTG